jgi:thiamine biosynthesis lipoprotein
VPTRSRLGALRESVTSAFRRRVGAPRAVPHAFHYERVLGTSFELQVMATTDRAAREAEAAVLAELDRLAEILNGHVATSELARWLATHGVAVPVSHELAEVLEAGEAWRIWTGGAFNPAAVSLVELLRDPSADANGAQRPAGDAVQRAVRDRVRDLGQPLWAVDVPRGLACRLTTLPVSLDALAKGYIVERVASCAAAIEGVHEVLVNIGGDLRHVGQTARAVGVADPRSPAENAAPIGVVRLRNEALATSGGYRRGFTMGGRVVSHILDPRTGTPADAVISASVIAPDCATADALSTAFSVLSPSDSVMLADLLPGVGCLVMERDGTMTSNATWQSRAMVS